MQNENDIFTLHRFSILVKGSGLLKRSLLNSLTMYNYQNINKVTDNRLLVQSSETTIKKRHRKLPGGETTTDELRND